MNLIARIESGMTTAADAALVRRVVETWKINRWAQGQLIDCDCDTDEQVWTDHFVDVQFAEWALHNALNALRVAADDEAP